MNIFTELSLILVLTAIISGIVRLLKQPLVTGYILTGLVIGTFLAGRLDVQPILAVFSEMGVSILLFIVGLTLSPREVKSFGRPAALIGFFQVLLTTGMGTGISYLCGFSLVESIYVGLALTFSSTIIVLKLLSDKKDLEMLYGRLALGILLFQDVVACLVLVIVSALNSADVTPLSFLVLITKGLVLTAAIFFVSSRLLPKWGKFFARSHEYLFIFSLAWGLGLASAFQFLGFSLEIGALLAGISLSMSPYSQEMSARLKPLRDFFVLTFFITLGAGLNIKHVASYFSIITILVLFVLFVKPLLILILMGISRYNRKTAFFEGVSLSQLSEFSLILVVLGAKSGQISQSLVPIITVTGFITIAISSYVVMMQENLYPFVSRYLRVFERKPHVKEATIVANYEVILFGCNRLAYDFVRVFKELGSGFIGVDFDPVTVTTLEKEGINCMYGDAEDAELLEILNVTKAKIIISTIPDFEVNSFILSKVRNETRSPVVVVISYSIDDALKLYELGASYVIMPHFISGEFAAKIATEAGYDSNVMKEKKSAHIKYLKERKAMGHSHPTWSHSV